MHKSTKVHVFAVPALALALTAWAGCGDDSAGDGADAGGSDKDAAANGAADAGDASSASTTPRQPADFGAALALPVAEDKDPDANVVEIDLVAEETEVEYEPGVKTRVWAYNGSVPGPTIEAKVGDKLIVNFTNRLPEPTTVHWHGVESPAHMDGSNMAQLPVAADGGSFRYEMTLTTAATYWYHPHITTHVQVEMGLHGALVVRDPDEDAALELPEDELLLLFDDILLDDAGQVAPPYPDDPIRKATMQLNGREGDLLLINGRPAGDTIPVVAGVPVRMRAINVANSRFFRLSMPGQTLYRIGGDSGLIAEPIAGAEIGKVAHGHAGVDAGAAPAATVSDPDSKLGVMIVPGERADIVFTPVGGPGDELVLEWHDAHRGLHEVIPNPDTGMLEVGREHIDSERPSKPLLTFRIADDSPTSNAVYQPPSSLRPVEAIDVTGAEILPVHFGHALPDLDGNVVFFAKMKDGAGLPFSMMTAEDGLSAKIGQTYIWEVVNMTGSSHPFHPHGFFFQAYEIEYRDMDTPDNNRVEPIDFVENKDTINIPARLGARGRSQTVMRMAVRFDDTGREGMVAASGMAPTESSSGGWVVHCHVLEHADLGMITFLNLE
ncbi:MAG: multicopper oxidase family protein [Myxococcales bacterium]|nr:multicopper oxidase family protein [Myxococcales bacterium]